MNLSRLKPILKPLFKPLLRKTLVMLSMVGGVGALGALPVACSDEDCTAGTVGIDLTVPSASMATFVDVTFAYDGAVMHRERLAVPTGASRVSADIKLPGGYPAGKYVSVTAVAKRLEGSAEPVVGTWFVSRTFPKGCVAFVATFFPTNTSDAGDVDGGFFFDGGAVDAGPGTDAKVTGDAGGDAVTDVAASDGAAADAGGDAEADAPQL